MSTSHDETAAHTETAAHADVLVALPAQHEPPLMLPAPGADGRRLDDPAFAAQGHKGGGEHGAPQMDIPPIGTGKVILLLIGFGLAFAALFVLGLLPTLRDKRLAGEEAKANANDKPVVNVAYPKAPTTMPTLRVPGSAQAYQVTQIYPRTNGYLKKLHVDIGDHVTEGQLLAEIDTPEVDAQLAAAQANLQQAVATQQRAQDDFDLNKVTLERYQGFASTGGVTQQQLDERKSAFTNAKSALAGAEASFRADQAEVQRLTALQGFEKIYAPFAGTINTRGYDVGALLSASGPSGSTPALFQISQTETLRTYVDIPQSYATGVQINQRVEFDVPNYPGKPFEGFIARTSGSINLQTRTLRVEADFPNKDGRLYPGMYGTLLYQPERQGEHLMIPSSALIYGPEGMRVAVIDDQKKTHFRVVAVGSDLGTEIEVTNGLTAGEQIVANPGERIADGVEVEIAKPDGRPQQGADNKPAMANAR